MILRAIWGTHSEIFQVWISFERILFLNFESVEIFSALTMQLGVHKLVSNSLARLEKCAKLRKKTGDCENSLSLLFTKHVFLTLFGYQLHFSVHMNLAGFRLANVANSAVCYDTLYMEKDRVYYVNRKQANISRRFTKFLRWLQLYAVREYFARPLSEFYWHM